MLQHEKTESEKPWKEDNLRLWNKDDIYLELCKAWSQNTSDTECMFINPVSLPSPSFLLWEVYLSTKPVGHLNVELLYSEQKNPVF